jgi:hypothetical protein
LGGGFYGAAAFKIFFQNLDPNKMPTFILYDGDTNETLNGTARIYCIAVKSSNPSTINYLKEKMSQINDKGLLKLEKRFIEGNVTKKHPLVLSAQVNSGNINLNGDYFGIRAGAAETEWKII